MIGFFIHIVTLGIIFQYKNKFSGTESWVARIRVWPIFYPKYLNSPDLNASIASLTSWVIVFPFIKMSFPIAFMCLVGCSATSTILLNYVQLRVFESTDSQTGIDCWSYWANANKAITAPTTSVTSLSEYASSKS